ncbi:MAG TPA: LytR C-terminal domain-containing protein [Thermoleophilaceae bacterium]|nr:LytR C-terminal domain-containing protein [Thermoleophilaceae bacterium]
MTALHAAGGGLPLALHIPHVVEQAGSMAGFAAVVGLAILSALYFSQARDLRRLREWAGRAPERAAEGQPAAVPGRVVAVPQRPAQPLPHPSPGPPPAAASAAAAAPAAAPANGAPGEAETEKEEAAEGEEKKEEQAAPPAAATSNGDSAPSVAAGEEAKVQQPAGSEDESKAEQPAAAEDGSKPQEPAAPAKPGMPAPASAAAAAAGAGAASLAGPAVAKAGGAQTPAGAPPRPAGAPPAGGPPRPAAGPQRPPGSVLPPRTGTLPPVRRLPSSNMGSAQTGMLGAAPPQEPKRRNPVYIVLAVVGVLVVGAAAAIGVPALVNGAKDTNSSSTTASTKSKTTATKSTPVVAPDKITVAVLNGTSIQGLAAQVGDRVDAEGFTKGTVSNASPTSGQRARSVAMYAPGHRSDAVRVGRRLGIHDVAPIDANSRQIAGDASVVVVVGSDKTQ